MNTRRNLERNTPSFTPKPQNSSKGCPFDKFIKGLEKHSQAANEILTNPISNSQHFSKNFHNLQSHTAPSPSDQNFYSDSHLQQIFQSKSTQDQKNKQNFNPENGPLASTQSKLPITPSFCKKSKSKSPKNFIPQTPNLNGKIFCEQAFLFLGRMKCWLRICPTSQFLKNRSIPPINLRGFFSASKLWKCSAIDNNFWKFSNYRKPKKWH